MQIKRRSRQPSRVPQQVLAHLQSCLPLLMPSSCCYSPTRSLFWLRPCRSHCDSP